MGVFERRVPVDPPADIKDSKVEDEGFRFSKEDVFGLSLFAHPQKRRGLSRGAFIFQEDAGKVRLDPALSFLQKVLKARMPDDLSIDCPRDKNASMHIFIRRNRGRADTLMLAVESDVTFRNTSNGETVSLGSIRLNFKMHEKKIHGKWGYEFESIQTESPLIAAFFDSNPVHLADALHEIKGKLAVMRAPKQP